MAGAEVGQRDRQQQQGEGAQDRQRPGREPGRGGDGDERGRDGEVPGAGLVRHVHRRAHRRRAGGDGRPGQHRLGDADGEEGQAQAVPTSRERAAAATPGSSRGRPARTAAVRSGTAGARREPGAAGDPSRHRRAQAAQPAQAARCSSSSGAGIPSGSPSSRAETASRKSEQGMLHWSSAGRRLVPGADCIRPMKMESWTSWHASRRTPPGATPWPRPRSSAPPRPTSGGCAPPSATAGSADDLTQETYLRAFGSLHRFEHRSSVRTWLLSIARRVCADAVRSRRRRRLTLVRDDRRPRGPAPAARPADPVAEGAAVDRPARPPGRRPPGGVRAHPAAGPPLRRGGGGRRLPGRHHPLPRRARPRRPVESLAGVNEDGGRATPLTPEPCADVAAAPGTYAARRPCVRLRRRATGPDT